MPDDEALGKWLPAWRKMKRGEEKWMVPDWSKVVDVRCFFEFRADEHRGRGANVRAVRTAPSGASKPIPPDPA